MGGAEVKDSFVGSVGKARISGTPYDAGGQEANHRDSSRWAW